MNTLNHLSKKYRAVQQNWRLKTSRELLELKICDPAMGSGAFLVQACRYLSERLVESWKSALFEGQFISVDGEIFEDSNGREELPTSPEECRLIARRLVAERCLYGVDLNPMAVELAKVSIWLVTLAKGRPFGFLDHNLYCGDSLLGVSHLNQLYGFTVNNDHQRHPRLFVQKFKAALDEAITLRQQIRESPIRDIKDIEKMALLDIDARNKLKFSVCVADAYVGILLASGGSREMESRLDGLALEVDQSLHGDIADPPKFMDHACRDLSLDNRDGHTRNPLHWPIVFPEVFCGQNPGFDALIGNPPYLGGYKITGILGTAYREYLVEFIGNKVRKSGDLVAFFFLRASSLLKNGGCFGLLATNTIAEGDTREVGLLQLVKNGVIYSAYPNEIWPGNADVITSRIHFVKGEYNGNASIHGKSVTSISSMLSAEDEFTVYQLEVNKGKSFEGCKPYGMGFAVTPEEADQLLADNYNNKDCLYPFLIGDDLNSSPTQTASRWVISFWDWPEDRAKEYSSLYSIVEKRVKPERTRLNQKGEYALRKPLPQNWWIYGEKRPALYHAIGRHSFFEKHPTHGNYPAKPTSRVIASTRTTKYIAAVFFSEMIIFDQGLVVFPMTKAYFIAIMHSTIYDAWARKCASSLGVSQIYYNPSDCFDTFPFPDLFPVDEDKADFSDLKVSRFDAIGEIYYEIRRNYMIKNNIGLTQFYNAFNSIKCNDSEIIKLRELLIEIDNEILSSYGWSDLCPKYDFREVPYLPKNDCIRFTIEDSNRLIILQRLNALNNERYQIEKATQKVTTGNKIRNASKIQSVNKIENTHPALDFDVEVGVSNNRSVNPVADAAECIIRYLRKNSAWLSKNEIIPATRISESLWGAAINSILENGLVIRQGERRGTRYRLNDSGDSQ